MSHGPADCRCWGEGGGTLSSHAKERHAGVSPAPRQRDPRTRSRPPFGSSPSAKTACGLGELERLEPRCRAAAGAWSLLLSCLDFDTVRAMEPKTAKPIHFLGDSREALRDFPDDARYGAGVELRAVQTGLEPSDWKPMKTVGAGVREIRIREASGAFRVMYLATLQDRVLVLHAFQKKTQQTPQKDIDLAAKRLKTWKAEQ